MGFPRLRGFFVQDKNRAIFAPNTKVKYHPTLTKKLVNDHDQLFKCHVLINKSLCEREFKKVKEQFDFFCRLLRSHLLDENQLFLTYVEGWFSYIRENPKASEKEKLHAETISKLVHSYRVNMNIVTSDVVKYMNKYKINPVNHKNVREFDKDHRELGEKFAELVKEEEKNIYPLYLPDYTEYLPREK